MALDLVVEKLDGLPEPVQKLYVEKEGKFHLDVAGVEDTGGLKKALSGERKRASELEKSVNEWKALGKTPAEIQEMIDAGKTAQEKALRDAGKFDELLAQHRKESGDVLNQHKTTWEKERGTLISERDAAFAMANSSVLKYDLGAALTKAKVTPEGLDLLTDRLAKRVEFQTVDGQRKYEIKTPDGKAPMAGSNSDGLATFDDLVKEAVKIYPSLFEGTGSGGSGMDQRNTRRDAGKTISRAEFDKLDHAARAEAMAKRIQIVD